MQQQNGRGHLSILEMVSLIIQVCSTDSTALIARNLTGLISQDNHTGVYQGLRPVVQCIFIGGEVDMSDPWYEWLHEGSV